VAGVDLFLAACFAGFLAWNWAPAKMFMGDSCSGFPGVCRGALAVGTSSQGEFLNLWVWLILGGVFLMDATTTVNRRMIRGERWYQPHLSHAYQNLSRRFDSHAAETLGVLAINLE
jgi:Fuc2NAc and GlcNAc transferase